MTRPKKILVAYDGSADSKEALNWAIDLSLLSGSRVIAAHVVEPDVMHRSSAMHQTGYGVTLFERIVEIQKMAEQQMANVVEIGNQQGIQIKTELLYGNISASIIDYAQKNEVDMIVSGTKGHGFFEQLLMGSVARNLVSLSTVPVLLVKSTPA